MLMLGSSHCTHKMHLRVNWMKLKYKVLNFDLVELKWFRPLCCTHVIDEINSVDCCGSYTFDLAHLVPRSSWEHS